MKTLHRGFASIAAVLAIAAILIAATSVAYKAQNGAPPVDEGQNVGSGGRVVTGGGGIEEVAEDTSPTLGGSLDAGGFDITNIDDLAFTSGSILNFNSSDVTITHGSNVLTIAGGDLEVPTEAYDATGWNGDNGVPTKDAVRDKFESASAGSTVTTNVATSTAGDLIISGISVISGDVLMFWSNYSQNSGDSCNGSDNVAGSLQLKQSTMGATSTIQNYSNYSASSNGCSASAQGYFVATTTETINIMVDDSSDGVDWAQLMVQKIRN